MELILKVSAVAVVGAVLGLVLKKNTPEISMLLTMAVSCAVMSLIAVLLRDVLSFMSELTELTGIPSASVSALLKAVGIGIVSRLASDVCRDSGQAAAASSVELAGTVAALFTALPLMETVLEMIRALL